MAAIVTCFFDEDDFSYYYLIVTKGTQFDAPLDSYKLNDGFYFSGNKTERGTVVVRLRTAPSISIVVSNGIPIDFPSLVDKGVFSVHSRFDDCVLYRSVTDPSDFFATIRNDFSINAEFHYVRGLDFEILCNVVSYAK